MSAASYQQSVVLGADEHGRFFIGPHNSIRFTGSASGVAFVETVRAHITPAGGSGSGIEEAFAGRTSDGADRGESDHWEDNPYRPFCLRLDQCGDETELWRCLTQYFAVWHPLFPFLDGRTVQGDLQQALRGKESHRKGDLHDALAFPGDSDALRLVKTVIITAIISVARIGQPAASGDLPVFRSTREATNMAYMVVDACDHSAINNLLAIQALVAVDLYLYALHKIRQASHLSGIILRLAFEAGLHRCPGRYPRLFVDPHACELRKRLFYSIYVLDRLLSQALGSPLLLNDTDIDVCLPAAPEKHVASDKAESGSDLVSARFHGPSIPSEAKRKEAPNGDAESNARSTPTPRFARPPSETTTPVADGPSAVSSNETRLLAANSLVRIVAISGKLMEAFNKSAKYRAEDPEIILALRADLDEWWNEIGLDSEDHSTTEKQDPRLRYATLFTCLYHQQLIHFNRHALSLRPDQPQHRFALQAAISSVRRICGSLSRQVEVDVENAFWPGYIDMIFFASLILAYASRRQFDKGGSYAIKVQADLTRAVKVLRVLHNRWEHLEPMIKVVEALGSMAGGQTNQNGQLRLGNDDGLLAANKTASVGPFAPFDMAPADLAIPFGYADPIDLDFLNLFSFLPESG